MASAYDKKFEEMKEYIPFLENMIKRHENSGRQAQLDKIRSLRDLLLDKKRRMKMENLLKCEQVLINLYAKVQPRDSIHGLETTTMNVTKQTVEKEPTISKPKSDLEIVRNKLKTVTKIQEAETLPDIARATDVELQYVGNREPTLFQRRPNKSPTHSAQISPSGSKNKSSPNQPKRNYTRVLVSPDRSPRRWSSTERSSSDIQLFNRRSPPPRPVSPPASSRKEKKKFKSHKTKTANIVLNVPTESLKNISEDNMLMNDDDEADLKTFYEMRSRILEELKESGNNEDISNLILQSYKTSKSKKKIKKTNSKDDVEEGELSDSESEAIGSIYGSLPSVEKVKDTKIQTKATEGSDKQHRKIHISLSVPVSTDNSTRLQHPVIDLSDEECDKSKEVISVDSDSSPTKKTTTPNKQHNETAIVKNKIDFTNVDPKLDKQNEIHTECINIDDDVEVLDDDGTQHSPQVLQTKNNCDELKQLDTVQSTVQSDSEMNDQNSKRYENQDSTEKHPKNIANFYKPIEDEPVLPDTPSSSTQNFTVANVQKTPDKDASSVHAMCTSVETLSTSTLVSILSEGETSSAEITNKNTVQSINKTTSREESEIHEKKQHDKSQNIPLLDEPTEPPIAKSNVVSEIDILQALKNEILSESIPVPGAETTTPPLHQPKVLTKVASAQDILFPKKKITLEAYKEKAPITKQTPSKPKIYLYKDKKQSLQLTDKECERFHLPKRLSVDDDDDDIDDIYRDDLTEENVNSDTLNNIYSDFAPKSPDCEILNSTDTAPPPVIIPVDPVKNVTVNAKIDVDMRPALSQTSKPSVPPLQPPPLLSLMGLNDIMTPSTAYDSERNRSDVQRVEPLPVNDNNKFFDPRTRRDTSVSVINSPNPYATMNPERTPRSASYGNVVSSAPNMVLNRAGGMTPNRTPSYTPSVSQRMTPNPRMTPSHQTFELEEPSSRKHVYAPSFSMCDNRDRESSVSRDGPLWEMNKNETRRSRRSRWEESNIPTGGPKWEMRDLRRLSNQNDGSRTPRHDDSYSPSYEKYNDHTRHSQGRRDTSYSKSDGPMTPRPSFGWSECPATPGSAFGRQEAPMTPSHPFGRSDCPSTPVHPFGQVDCPPTPSSGFGRNPDNPSFGRSDGSLSHQFGRSESSSYTRPECMTSSNQNYLKDPRLNRGANEFDRNRDYSDDRARKDLSYKPPHKHYAGSERSRNYERERSVGRSDRNYGDNYSYRYDRDRRDTSVGRTNSNDYENSRFRAKNRQDRFDDRYSYHNDGIHSTRQNLRERSVSRTSNTYEHEDRSRSSTRATSVGRSSGNERNDNISFKSDTGRNFTINTSVKSTFQNLQATGDFTSMAKNTFHDRRQRAASVGRSLARENSVGRTLTPISISCSNVDIRERFKRASSVGRDSKNVTRTLKEIKADFEAFKSKILTKKNDTHNTTTKNSKNLPISHSKRDDNQSQCDRNTDKSKLQYSPRKNSRDPRMQREQKDERYKSRYKIDRRSDSQNHKKTGIVYSNDNIAKGQIMGAGFGVKNYKIPKIKRPEPEPEAKAKPDEKKTDKPCVESDKKSDATKTLTVNNKKSKSKEALTTVDSEIAVKAKIKNAEKKDSGKGDETGARVTRSRKKSESNESKDVLDDLNFVPRTRKCKKSVIQDSDSDLENEGDTKPTKKDNSQPSSPSKTSKVTSSPKTDKEQPTEETDTNKATSGTVVSMEDMFSDNMPSDPIIDNINDLIADLDHDLNSSKVSNDSFTHELDQIFDAVDSSENRLGDISEVIEKDLSESNAGITLSHLLSTNIVTENSQENAFSKVYPQNKTNDPQSVSQAIQISKNDEESTLFEKNKDEPKMSNDVHPFEKVNDNIVSTTDVDSLPRANRDVQKANSDDQSGPDSTINKITLGKPLPDSTNEELSSDVTSTNENTETFNKDSQKESAKEPFNQIGNLLSILQDKSKIKELLSMLGEQSNSENEKIKKKLEMLSQIVSDDEDDDRQTDEKGQKDKNRVNIVLNDAKNGDTSDMTCDESNKTVLASNSEKSIDKSNISPDLDRIDETSNTTVVNKDSVENGSNIKDTSCNISNETITSAYESQSKSECADTSKELVASEVTVNKELSQNTNEIDDMNDKNQSSEDDEPLVKKGTKKVKGTKAAGKNKPMLKKKFHKRTTRASAKPGVKKRGELQKLQEDIKEMFMSQDILNATGIRMCRLAKMVNEKSNNNSEAVVLEKSKGVQNLDQPVKARKKPGPKPKAQADKRSDSFDEEKMLSKPKIVSKTKPGPKSKTKTKYKDTDPYEFETDSVADTSTTKDSDSDSSDSETSSLASSRSFGSSEALSAETKKKPKRKRRGAGGWQSGIIKPRKKKEKLQESRKLDAIQTQPQTPYSIPDLHCFTDKSYCFQKGVTTYDCRLCVYNGKDIVKHFKEEHPHTEIPLSRLDQKTADLAIKQCEEENYLELKKVATEKYSCRFCHKEFSNGSNVLETFFWHVVTNHTGEFKYLCPECLNITPCPFNLDIPPPPKEEGQLIGYICKKCNFTQISLRNLKTHVIEQHRDEETEVFTINLAVMTNKAMKAMLKRARSKATVNRSLRSNHSAVDTSDAQDDSTDASEASSVRSSEFDTSILQTLSKSSEEIETEATLQIPKTEKINTKLTFENDEPSVDTNVKMEQEDTDVSVLGVSLGTIGVDDAFDTETENATPVVSEQLPSQRSDSIMDYAHFKLNYTASGAKEYVCCINGNDGHYKTSLLISLKKHIRSKHSEKWDGYCCICRVLVTLQGVQSNFVDCLSHFLDKHMDDFPVLEKVPESSSEIMNMPETGISTDVAVPAAMVPEIIPARVMTPPERTASPSYIAVRPLAELLCRAVSQTETPLDRISPSALPKIECVVSLGNENSPAPASLASPRPCPPIAPEKPFLYEEAQAEVMSKKHRVVLEAMMSKESLVRVFKCAGRFCSFTTDSANDALTHASAHQRVGGEGALQCSYCNYDARDNGIDLVMHVFKEHEPCQYCCPSCFYRAAAPQLVHAHYRVTHVGAPPLMAVLRSTARVLEPDPGNKQQQASMLPRDVAVQLYICNQDRSTCTFQTYISQKLVEHLKQKHPNATSHQCHLCPATPTSAGELVIHLRAHGLRLYQCPWCVHGANFENEMLAHVAACHPHRQPSAYMRIIKIREEGSRVLPLAILNTPNVPTEDVILSASPSQNPEKEADRSIDLEKLIGHTMVNNEVPTDRATEHLPIEESDDASENIEELDNDDPSPLEALLTSVETEELTSDTTETQTALEKDGEAVVKTEPTEVAKSFSSSEVICLDSDEEIDETEQESATSPADVCDVTEENDVTSDKDGGDVNRSSVTDEVSITKLPRDSLDNDGDQLTPIPNRLIQNVIDISDDEPSASTTVPDVSTESSIIIQDKHQFFKCPRCYTACKSAHALKIHVEKQCSMPTTGLMMCPHTPCTDAAPDLPRLIAHYHEKHRAPRGRKQNFCGMCRGSFTTLAGAKLHIRSVHKVTNYEVRGEKSEGCYRYYVVENKAAPVRASARKTSTEIQRYTDEPAQTRQRKTATESKKRYGIADINKLPISPILDAAVFCELCEFGTKVRVNMVRHLQQHASGGAPRTAPVNPVPHLETNEMHFDKMVNLASSSLGPTRPVPGDAARYPRYVSDRARWACGARACDYTSLDAAMFRRHWDTLHAAEHSYRCPHCPPNQELNTAVPLSAKRILWHLCMHDASLYACSACSYYHFKRHMVEKHAADTHRGVPAAVRVVREPTAEPAAAPEPAAPAASAPSVPAAPTMDLKRWQCGLCPYSNLLRNNVVNHCAADHNSKMQFKCSYCPFRTSAIENVHKHQTNVHPNKPEDVFYYFYKEGSVPEVDGVALWQRQRQKQGLDELKTEPDVDSEALTQVITPAKTPIAIDLNIVKEEIPDEATSSELSIEALCAKFGEFCEPDGIKYKCCLCNAVRELARDTMQGHLYEELKYRRWECVTCSYKAFHQTGLNDHTASEHPRQFNPPKALPTDTSIEKWVQAFLDHQQKSIETNLKNLSVQKIQGERTTITPASKQPEAPKPTSSASDAELENAFGEFGAPKNQQYACPKCDFVTKDEAAMVTHLESELSKIRWGCTSCSSKYTTFHEAQFHCKSAHIPPGRPKEAIRDPSLRFGWVKAVVKSQKQFIKCISANRELSPDRECEQSENSLLVAMYDEPVHIEERVAPAKRSAPANDSDDERLVIDERQVIDEPPAKKAKDTNCPYCEYSVKNSRYLREHILAHLNIKPYKCAYCSWEGTRASVCNHLSTKHPAQPKNFVTVEVPTLLPPIDKITQESKEPEPAAKTFNRDTEEVTKKVCLYCEKSVPETDIEAHSHGTEKTEFAKRGEVVVKCCKCLVLRLTKASLQDHFDTCHPGEKVLDNYAYFKLQVDTREIYCCGHCYKKFKFIRDLKAHHMATHTSLPLSYTSIPFSHNLHTEGDCEQANKRKLEDTAGPSSKKVAKKSTSKLPNSAVAKKSTTKLPLDNTNEEYSYYGDKPSPISQLMNVMVNVPTNNSVEEMSLDEVMSVVKVNPRVVVKDFKKH